MKLKPKPRICIVHEATAFIKFTITRTRKVVVESR